MKKSRNIHKFTLVELMMAMAIFTIISLVMMRFFNSAQQVWSKTSQRNSLYSSARIALDLMARDLQCAFYKNDDSERGIYPFWFQKIKDLNTISADYYPASRFGPNPNIPTHAWTCLNFIAPTMARPAGVKSSICKIRYTFIPSGTVSGTSGCWLADGNGGKIFDNNNDEDDSGWQGWLVRSCTGDLDSTGKSNPKYNFSQLPITAFRPANGLSPADKWRMNAIWIQNANYDVGTNSLMPAAAASSFNAWEKVIPHVVELFLECYYYDNTGTMQRFPPMTLDALAPVADTPAGTPIWDSKVYGTKFPVMALMQISLLSDSDWRNWRNAVKSGNTAAADTILSQKLRTFSKVVFLNKKESN